jgi:hypothetical protein
MSTPSSSLPELAELDRTVARAEVERDIATLDATHIAVRDEDPWRLAGIHLSPIGGPPPFARPAGSETADPR